MVGSPLKTTRFLAIEEPSPGESAPTTLPAKVDAVLRCWRFPRVGVCSALMVRGVLAREFPNAPIIREPPKLATGISSSTALDGSGGAFSSKSALKV